MVSVWTHEIMSKPQLMMMVNLLMPFIVTVAG